MNEKYMALDVLSNLCNHEEVEQGRSSNLASKEVLEILTLALRDPFLDDIEALKRMVHVNDPRTESFSGISLCLAKLSAYTRFRNCISNAKDTETLRNICRLFLFPFSGVNRQIAELMANLTLDCKLEGNFSVDYNKMIITTMMMIIYILGFSFQLKFNQE